MVEKYESGTLHPSELYQMFQTMDIYDQARFIQMIYNDPNYSSIRNIRLKLDEEDNE